MSNDLKGQQRWRGYERLLLTLLNYCSSQEPKVRGACLGVSLWYQIQREICFGQSPDLFNKEHFNIRVWQFKGTIQPTIRYMCLTSYLWRYLSIWIVLGRVVELWRCFLVHIGTRKTQRKQQQRVILEVMTRLLEIIHRPRCVSYHIGTVFFLLDNMSPIDNRLPLVFKSTLEFFKRNYSLFWACVEHVGKKPRGQTQRSCSQ